MLTFLFFNITECFVNGDRVLIKPFNGHCFNNILQSRDSSPDWKTTDVVFRQIFLLMDWMPGFMVSVFRWNGTVYPKGLKGSDIPESARLMALADVYDALISKRIYKPAFSHEKARETIVKDRGKRFDPDIVDAFLEIEEEFKAIAAQYPDKE